MGRALQGHVGILALVPERHRAHAMTMNATMGRGVETGLTPDPWEIAPLFPAPKHLQ